MDRRGLIIGYAMALAGAALFSSKAIFIKLAYVENSDALLILAWRMIFSLPFFAGAGIAVMARNRRLGKPQPDGTAMLRALAAGIAGYYVSMLLDFQALVFITASLERLALFTYPIFLLFIGAGFFGLLLRPRDFIAAAVSYAGLALVFLADFRGGGENLTLGILLVLGSALVFAIYQLFATKLIGELGSVMFTSLALSGAGIAGLVHFFLLRQPGELVVSSNYLALAAATGLIATVIPSFLINAGMGRIGAQSTAMISTLSPLLTIGMAVAALGERFALVDAIGTALVVGGVGFHTWRNLKK